MLKTRFKKAISLYLALQITVAPLYATLHEMATDRIHGGNLIASRQGAQQINFGATGTLMSLIYQEMSSLFQMTR